MPTVLVHSDTTKSLAELEDRLASSRGIFSKVRALTKTGALNAEELDVVEEVLLRSDVGLATTNEILDVLRRDGAPLGVTSTLRELLLRFLDAERSLRYDASENHVAVWLFVGVNGVGKTTTIGKLAQRLSNEGRSVLLAAGDTFRAAAAEQLEQWGSRSGADIVRSSEGADPGSVVHDAIGRAFAKGSTMVLADTAGRRSNSTNLLDELSKIRRVADRTPGEVLETLLVLDATTGQNALAQAREFLRAASVTGIVLTKLDGTARGGIVVAIEKELAIPVKFVGVGEGVDDLIPFDPATFVDSLLEP
jgi:fused signal recognition particle receptor